MTGEGGGDERILTAFVEFTHKGMQGIFDTAAAIKRHLENADFKKAAEITFTAKADQATRYIADVARAERAERDHSLREASRLDADLSRARLTTMTAEQTELQRQKDRQAADANRSLTREFDMRNRRESDLIKMRLQGDGQNGQMNWIDMFGQGLGLRRIISSAVTGAFGDSAGKIGELIGGVGGMLGNLAFLKMAWGVQAILSDIPGLVGDQVDLARYGRTLGQRSGTQAGAARWNEAAGATRHFWANTRDEKGVPGDETVLGLLQRSQMRPGGGTETERSAYAERVANQAMMLSRGPHAMMQDPSAMVDALTDLRFGSNPTQAKAWLANQPFFLDRLARKWKTERPEYQGWSLENVRGRVSEAAARPEAYPMLQPLLAKDLEGVIHESFNDPRVRGELEAQLKEWRGRSIWGPRGFEFWKDDAELTDAESRWVNRRRRQIEGKPYNGPGYMGIGAMVESADDMTIRSLSAERRAQLERYARGEAGNWTSLPGLESRPPAPAHSIEPPGQFSFTSLSGLAEQMQVMASQQLDIPQQQLRVMEEIRDRMPDQQKAIETPAAPRGMLPP